MTFAENARFAPSLPMGVLVAVTIATGALTLLATVRSKSGSGGFMIFSTWFRYIIGVFHEITYRSIGPMSVSALSSIAVFGVGLLFIKRRLLMLNFLVPIYIVMIVVIISAMFNNQYVGMVNVLVKYGFLIVVILTSYDALQKMPPGRYFRLMLFSFLPLLIFQLASIGLGVIKAGENDGSVSYIGGYGHEATFSTMLMTLFIVAIFATRLHPIIKNGFVLAACVGIFLANYRTTIIAMAPILAIYFGLMPVQRFTNKDRPFVAAFFIILVCILFGVASLALGDRFADLGTASSTDVNLFKPPQEYSVDESRILSGRPMIWAGYVYGWLEGTGLQHIIGFGPESWTERFKAYAHNTLVNCLYEYGPVGVLAVLYLWIAMLAAALKVKHPHRNLVVAAQVGFILLNMATMPLWMIEGNIAYGLICGYTLHLLKNPRVLPVVRTRRAWRRVLADPTAEPRPAPSGGGGT